MHSVRFIYIGIALAAIAIFSKEIQGAITIRKLTTKMTTSATKTPAKTTPQEWERGWHNKHGMNKSSSWKPHGNWNGNGKGEGNWGPPKEGNHNFSNFGNMKHPEGFGSGKGKYNWTHPDPWSHKPGMQGHDNWGVPDGTNKIVKFQTTKKISKSINLPKVINKRAALTEDEATNFNNQNNGDAEDNKGGVSNKK